MNSTPRPTAEWRHQIARYWGSVAPAVLADRMAEFVECGREGGGLMDSELDEVVPRFEAALPHLRGTR